MSSPLLITIIVPCRNEEIFIGKVLDDIVSQDFSAENIEVIVVDGISTDNTKHIAESYKVKLQQLIILDNINKTVPFALNLAIKQSKGNFIIRMDAHTEYSKDYVTQVMETFSSTNADIVGGPMRATGNTRMQKAIAFATSTKFGVGDSKFHDEQAAGYTDSVYLGAWRKEIFQDVGLFDVEMVRNQDDEFHYRARSKGKAIYLNPSIKSWYYPRASIKALFSQYFQYGLYKPLVLKKVRSGIKLRHLIPTFFVLYLISLPVLYFYFKASSMLPCLFYIIGLFVYSLKNPDSYAIKITSAVAYLTIHVAYGTGFITGLSKIIRK